MGSISSRARATMFDWLMELAAPSRDTTVLDVGVTNDTRSDSNFFEKLYLHPDKLTAVGLEDCAFIETQFPGVKFIKADGKNLPFADKSYDLCVCFAVIEHVGSREQQRLLVNELCRVAKKVCITTPNRWFPLELHSMLPFVHWLPPATFRKLIKTLGHDFLSQEENLNLLDMKELLALVPRSCRVTAKQYRLLGFVSNLFLFIES